MKINEKKFPPILPKVRSYRRLPTFRLIVFGLVCYHSEQLSSDITLKYFRKGRLVHERWR